MLFWRSAVLGQSDLNNGDDLNLFFELYAQFLAIDSINTLVYGRNRSLIKTFYEFYYFQAMSRKNKNLQKKLKETKDKLKKEWVEYIKGYSQYCSKEIQINQQSSSVPRHIIENPNISEAFSCFVDAIQQYEKWRSRLSNEHILSIYRKNLEDRQKYYADDGFDEFNEELLKKINIEKLKNNKILKQTLIEFHNAISHLVAVYCGRQQDGKNKDRAINHFRRGALDSYKAIIKDFYHLRNVKKVAYKPSLKKIKDIRREEYLGIGSDKDISKKYKNFTDELIASIHTRYFDDVKS